MHTFLHVMDCCITFPDKVVSGEQPNEKRMTEIKSVNITTKKVYNLWLGKKLYVISHSAVDIYGV